MGYGKINANRFVNAFGATPQPLAHNIAVGPFLSFPGVTLVNNTPYNIRTAVSNIGSNNETGIPVKFFVDNVLVNITNINLNANAVDSVTTNSGNIQYTTQGSAPNRIFIVQYTNVGYFSGAGNITFQICPVLK